jgi:hypothetical protein
MPQPIARVGTLHVSNMTPSLPAPNVGGPNPQGAPTVIFGKPPSIKEGNPADAIGPADANDPTVIISTTAQINAVEKQMAEQSKAKGIDIRV